MGCAILDPRVRVASRKNLCALTVMSKAPRPGRVKTRLSPPLTPEQAAQISICFLRDTTENIAAVARQTNAAGLLAFTPAGDEHFFDGIIPDCFALIAQRGDGFGERLLAAAEDIFACGYGSVCLIDSDSPTLPTAVLRQAVEALAKPGNRVVLGGSDDGGYYLIGLKAVHAAPFARITWSTGSVYQETVQRVSDAGLELVELPIWYDVDDRQSLSVLYAELIEGSAPNCGTIAGYQASATRRFLETLELPTNAAARQ